MRSSDTRFTEALQGQPSELAVCFEAAAKAMIDPAKWRKALAKEARGRKLLTLAAENWTKVEKSLGK